MRVLSWSSFMTTSRRQCSRFSTPMRAYDLVEAFSGQRRALQIIGRFDGNLSRDFPRSDHLADASQTGPVMVRLKRVDRGCDRGRAGLDAAMIAINGGIDCADLALQVVEKADHIVMQLTLVALQRQHVVAALIDDLLGDLSARR